MFSDPLSVTYNSVAKSLARTTGTRSGVSKQLGHNVYGTADGEFQVFVTQSSLANQGVRSEILLSRTSLDADGPFAGNFDLYPNRVGLVYEVNSLRVATAVDVPLLRSALLSLVDSTFQSRLIAGEL
jgi:hypothetical protein